MRASRATAMVACVSTVALLAGCGANERDEVQAKVAQFVHAIAGRDYRTLCTQVLAPSLLTRLAAGGIPCDQAMQISLSSVRDPLLSVGRVTINGSSAQAITLTGAAGERGAFESINLVKTGDGWRISSLAAPRISSARR